VHRHPVSPLESVTLFLSRLKTAGLGRKILWGKDLAKRYSVFKEPFLTAIAGAIMNEFEMRRKVRCHTGGLWKTVGGESGGAPSLHFGERVFNADASDDLPGIQILGEDAHRPGLGC